MKRKHHHVSVRPKKDEPIDKTIKRFSRKVKKSGVIDEFKNRRHYKKPSVKRREKESIGKFKERQIALLNKEKQDKS